jgi:hypothetical protein
MFGLKKREEVRGGRENYIIMSFTIYTIYKILFG